MKVNDSGENSKVDEASLSGYCFHGFFLPRICCCDELDSPLNNPSGVFVFIYERELVDTNDIGCSIH